MRLLWFGLSLLWGTFRETLPESEHEAGVFLAGMIWAFVIFIGCLLFTSCAVVSARGGI